MTNNNIHGTGANGATRQLAITLPVYLDGDQCGNTHDNYTFRSVTDKSRVLLTFLKIFENF